MMRKRRTPEKTGTPEHDEDRVDDLTSMMVAGECKGYDGEDDEISTASEV